MHLCNHHGTLDWIKHDFCIIVVFVAVICHIHLLPQRFKLTHLVFTWDVIRSASYMYSNKWCAIRNVSRRKPDPTEDTYDVRESGSLSHMMRNRSEWELNQPVTHSSWHAQNSTSPLHHRGSALAQKTICVVKDKVFLPLCTAPVALCADRFCHSMQVLSILTSMVIQLANLLSPSPAARIRHCPTNWSWGWGCSMCIWGPLLSDERTTLVLFVSLPHWNRFFPSRHVSFPCWYCTTSWAKEGCPLAF
jgi:hypothetical protein